MDCQDLIEVIKAQNIERRLNEGVNIRTYIPIVVRKDPP